MDMDGLKKINDELGHKAGDEALALIARTLKRTFRDGDLVARFGGDEFAALVPCTEEQGHAICARIQENLRGLSANGSYPIGLSVGESWLPKVPEGTIEELLVAADREMYETKRRRKQRRVEAEAAPRSRG
jgi:diguanylate cyclase (GGDEF)-like protein